MVLSGGSIHRASDKKIFDGEIELIKKAAVPTLGICLGFELIVLAFGGSIGKLDKEHVGLAEISVVEEDRIFSGIKSFLAYEHHWFTARVVPKVLKVLAVSGKEVSVVRHETLPVYGFQFHPEHGAGENQGADIFLNFLKII